MPTETEFTWAANAYEDVAAQLGSLLQPSEQMLGPDTVSGGQLALVIQATIDASSVNVRRCIEDFLASARICRHRAAVCSAHSQAIADYHVDLRRWRAFDGVGEPPTPPQVPAGWVDP